MKVLVTGGAGFIGSNLVRHLLAQKGCRVRVLDKLTYAGNLDNFPPALLKDRRFEFIRGDICAQATVRDALRGCDAVVNLAAETHIDRSNVDVRPFVRTDFVGTSVLLEAFRQRPLDRFVQVSTCEVYGTARRVPMAEDHPIEPQSPYAATKAGADRLCRSYIEAYGLPVVVLRPFNQYGPNQYPEKVIPFFITRALAGEPLYLYGSGRNTRDWTYVTDFCRLVQRVLEVRRDRVAGQFLNAGSGEETSALDIGRAVLRALGKPSSLLVHVRDRPGHVERLVGDSRKAKRLLGWTTTTGFAEGIGKTLRWYLQNRGWWLRLVRRKQYREFFHQWYGRTLGAGPGVRAGRGKDGCR
jgi:dTDP-glucose 4,6-dehydratase